MTIVKGRGAPPNTRIAPRAGWAMSSTEWVIRESPKNSFSFMPSPVRAISIGCLLPSILAPCGTDSITGRTSSPTPLRRGARPRRGCLPGERARGLLQQCANRQPLGAHILAVAALDAGVRLPADPRVAAEPRVLRIPHRGGIESRQQLGNLYPLLAWLAIAAGSAVGLRPRLQRCPRGVIHGKLLRGQGVGRGNI